MFLGVFIYLVNSLVLVWGSQSQPTLFYKTKPSGIFSNNLNDGSDISVSVYCKAVSDPVKVLIRWMLVQDLCLTSDNRTIQDFDNIIMQHSSSVTSISEDNATELIASVSDKSLLRVFQLSTKINSTQCESKQFYLKDESRSPYYIVLFNQGLQTVSAIYSVNQTQVYSVLVDKRVSKVWTTSDYSLYLNIEADTGDFLAQVIVDMKNKYGFLPADLFPFYPFYGVMAFFYLALSTTWILVWAYQHRHTYKIHVCLGIISTAGALAFTLKFMHYGIRNSNDYDGDAIKWSAVLFDWFQNLLFTIVLLTVSTGYGITRPVLSCCVKAFIALITAVWLVCLVILKVLPTFALEGSLKAIAAFPYVLMAVVIGVWVTVFSVKTLCELHSRGYAQKIVTFSIFTTSCIVALLTLVVAYTAFSVHYVNHMNCAQAKSFESTNLLAESLVSCTSYVLTAVLMWLWRPADVKLSYAFSPLLGDEDEEEEIFRRDPDTRKLEPL